MTNEGFLKNTKQGLGRGGGQVVSMLAFSSDDPSLNPAKAFIFSVKFAFEMSEMKKKKEARVGPFKHKNMDFMFFFKNTETKLFHGMDAMLK